MVILNFNVKIKKPIKPIDLTGFVDIKNYEGEYAINKNGDVYSHKRKKLLSPYYYKDSKVIDLCQNGKYKTYRINRLIKSTFPIDYTKELIGYKEIKEFNDYYINTNGDIIHLIRFNNIVIDIKKLIPQSDGNGYLFVHLSKNKYLIMKKIHKLVAETFIPNPDNLICVNHKDEDKSNNNINNLEWCTTSYNINYGTRTSRAIAKQSYKIKRIDIKTNNIDIFESINECARQMNITAGAIKYSLKHGSIYKYKYKFCYI